MIRLPYRPPFDWNRSARVSSPPARRAAWSGIDGDVPTHVRDRRQHRYDHGPAGSRGRRRRSCCAPGSRRTGRSWRSPSGPRRLFDLGADPIHIRRTSREVACCGRWCAARRGCGCPARGIRSRPSSARSSGSRYRWPARRRSWDGSSSGAAGGFRPITPDDGLTHLFPTPEELADAISSRSACQRSHRDAAADGASCGRRPVAARRGGAASDHVLDSLCAIHGIGPWTAHYIAMRALGEPDAFPSGDLGLRKAAGGGTPISARALEALAESWRPWRAYAAMYLCGRGRWGGTGDGDAIKGRGQAPRAKGRLVRVGLCKAKL